ncbi:MAG: SdrD B-like domain-containing protein, partial [Bacteroidota bacterium]
GVEVGMTDRAMAQTQYTYFPSASTTDGRFLSMAGTGISTLGQDIVLKVACPGAANTLEIGFFDGETGGQWDQGTVPLKYTLYSDPRGDASGTQQVAEWSGASMTDNDWYNVTVANIAAAKAPNGDYFYLLRVTSTDPTAFAWSNFKVRTNGTIASMRNQSFAYVAAVNGLADARVIFPNYPTLEPTTYDGTWNFFLNVSAPQGSFEVWDGDMDHGAYDCSDNDIDDPDTPNEIPSWATGTAAVAEGVAGGGTPCVDASGTATTGFTTSYPPDDSRIPALRRSPNVEYEVVDPNGVHYANHNPSGNLEWERFRLDTAAFNRTQMDYHAASLPAGVYAVRISGVDMSNLNAWRFPFDAVGVTANGVPVIPLESDFNDGVVDADIYYDANANSVRDAGEPGIPAVSLTLGVDYNQDGVADWTYTGTTDINGRAHFGSLKGGRYTLKTDTATLADDAVPTYDPDGIATPNVASFDLTLTHKTVAAPFGYRRTSPPGTGTRGYWVNHPENWPVSQITLGCVTYSQAEAIAILQKATKGDKTYIIASQLIATKLNLVNGNNSSCIAGTVASADDWMCSNPLGSGGKNAWTTGQVLEKALDDYNNGRSCASHMN